MPDNFSRITISYRPHFIQLFLNHEDTKTKRCTKKTHSLFIFHCSIVHFPPPYLLTILFPNGIRETSISLKCCRPKGIPIMVKHNRAPKVRWANAAAKPPQTIQIIFSSNERQPTELSVLTACNPKGLSTNTPILKHCKPKGIPTTVKQSTKPPIK